MIDLVHVTGNGEVRNLSGKERGIEARRYYNIDDLDDTTTSVSVRVPDNLIAISSSFFLGLFSDSITKFGGRDQFLSHYRFHAKPALLAQIDHAIDRALSSRGPLNSA